MTWGTIIFGGIFLFAITGAVALFVNKFTSCRLPHDLTVQTFWQQYLNTKLEITCTESTNLYCCASRIFKVTTDQNQRTDQRDIIVFYNKNIANKTMFEVISWQRKGDKGFCEIIYVNEELMQIVYPEWICESSSLEMYELHFAGNICLLVKQWAQEVYNPNPEAVAYACHQIRG